MPAGIRRNASTASNGRADGPHGVGAARRSVPRRASRRNVPRSRRAVARDRRVRVRASRPDPAKNRPRARPAASTAGVPVSSNTSSARWMRCASDGARRPAVAGSRRASSACSAGQPSAAARASILERTAASACGSALKPSMSALKYSIVPPTKSGSRPRARIAAAASSASLRKRAAEYASVGRDDVDEVMGNARACRAIRLRGADVHAAIHLRRIDADDLRVEAARERQRERALARRRGAHQQHRGWDRFLRCHRIDRLGQRVASRRGGQAVRSEARVSKGASSERQARTRQRSPDAQQLCTIVGLLVATLAGTDRPVGLMRRFARVASPRNRGAGPLLPSSRRYRPRMKRRSRSGSVS